MKIHFSGLLPEALLVDLPEIDQQHEEIFRRIESLKTTCFADNFIPIDDLTDLLDYFALHFATEERIADAAGLDFTDHLRIHEDTLRLLRKALRDVINGEHDAHSFLRYAEYWFERHISEDDRLFVATLQAGIRSRSGVHRQPASTCFAAQA
ncbi:MAG: hemerythrin family protein [Accumulibacter sp.]|uniref:bacteriohemerythrin n=1 Tax=Accumulibacter sp. TaxID=2053492 RepID=UPI003314B162